MPCRQRLARTAVKRTMAATSAGGRPWLLSASPRAWLWVTFAVNFPSGAPARSPPSPNKLSCVKKVWSRSRPPDVRKDKPCPPFPSPYDKDTETSDRSASLDTGSTQAGGRRPATDDSRAVKVA
ncbi:hypothetical protein SKAU_G00229670 [Synaphobranchus kaupii]|uniref:Uncharacterized protein n=1 Tax=Synaphobranchus kaupii TaxID=118154 RepID=A0A9Q1IT78_SYNKA|nr:hypothetical protein SKAU_G00229670 [Synaphobranchus kaupii]